MSDIGGGFAPSFGDLINATKHQANEIARLRAELSDAQYLAHEKEQGYERVVKEANDLRARIAELEDECAKHVETIGDRNRSLRLAEDHMDWFRGMCDDKDREIEALKKQLGIK